jgi:hypothetical protein
MLDAERFSALLEYLTFNISILVDKASSVCVARSIEESTGQGGRTRVWWKTGHTSDGRRPMIDTKLAGWHYGPIEASPAGKRERLLIASCCLTFKIMTMSEAAGAR